MIIGCVYRLEASGDVNGIPLFLYDNGSTVDVRGFPNITSDDMKFVLSWASKPTDDDIEIVWKNISAPYFLHLFRDQYVSEVPIQYVHIGIFKHLAYKYPPAMVQHDVTSQLKSLDAYWSNVARQVAGLTNLQQWTMLELRDLKYTPEQIANELGIDEAVVIEYFKTNILV